MGSTYNQIAAQRDFIKSVADAAEFLDGGDGGSPGYFWEMLLVVRVWWLCVAYGEGMGMGEALLTDA